jgi:hypothetical protein
MLDKIRASRTVLLGHPLDHQLLEVVTMLAVSEQGSVLHYSHYS